MSQYSGSLRMTLSALASWVTVDEPLNSVAGIAIFHYLLLEILICYWQIRYLDSFVVCSFDQKANVFRYLINSCCVHQKKFVLFVLILKILRSLWMNNYLHSHLQWFHLCLRLFADISDIPIKIMTAQAEIPNTTIMLTWPSFCESTISFPKHRKRTWKHTKLWNKRKLNEALALFY